MVEERRNDVGSKVVIGMMSSVMLVFVAMFINAAWATAHEGSKSATDAQLRVAVLEAQFLSFKSDLNEIKDLLKRDVPQIGGRR